MTEMMIREALLLGRSFVELVEEDLQRDCSESLKQIDEALALLSQSSPSGGGMCPPSMPEASPRESGVSGQQHAAMGFDPSKPVRCRNGWKARIICTDRRDNSMPIVYLYDDGSGEGARTAFANGMATEAPDDENIDLAFEPNPYDLLNVAEAPPENTAKMSAAKDVTNQSLQEGMVLVPREPTEEMIEAAVKGSPADVSYYDAEEVYRAMIASAPSSISQEQEMGV